MRKPSLLPDFGWLAEISTGRSTRLKGIIPPVKTILALLLTSVVIACGMWLLIGAGSAAAALGYSSLGVFLVAGVNFWFGREINTFMLSTREVREKFEFSKKDNATNLRELVEEVRDELNIYFRKEYGDQHVDLPMPRLLTFTDHHFKIITVEGRNPGKAALFFSTGVMNFHDTNLTHNELKALIQVELVKIYMRRGIARTIVGMGTDFYTTLDNFLSGNILAKVLGILAGRLQFFALVERSIKRSYEYEAAEIVVKCGRGVDLVSAIDRTVHPFLEKKPTYKELRIDQQEKKRPPYNGWLQFIFKPIADWIDDEEYAEDDKTGYRFFSFFDILVRELGYLIKELWSPTPRATRLKDYLKEIIKAPLPERYAFLPESSLPRIKNKVAPENWNIYLETNKKNELIYTLLTPQEVVVKGKLNIVINEALTKDNIDALITPEIKTQILQETAKRGHTINDITLDNVTTDQMDLLRDHAVFINRDLWRAENIEENVEGIDQPARVYAPARVAYADGLQDRVKELRNAIQEESLRRETACKLT